MRSLHSERRPRGESAAPTTDQDVERIVPHPTDPKTWFPDDPPALAASFRFATRRVLEIDPHERRARLLRVLMTFALASSFPDWATRPILEEIGRSHHDDELHGLELAWRMLLLAELEPGEEARDGRQVA